MSHRGSPKRNGPLPRDVQVSKKLSWLLRHGAEKEGLTMSKDGFINLAAVLANRNLRSLKVSFEEVQQIVHENDKQRFSMILDPEKYPVDIGGDAPENSAISTSTNPADWAIRANQGHSIKLESDAGLLTPITKENLPDMAIHGTTHANWSRIVSSGGLKPMGRNHVHFASGLPAGFKSLASDAADGALSSAPVISGMRSSSTILIYVDLLKALDAGLQFGLSQNGVILSEGNTDGLIPTSLFLRVEDRSGEGVLVQDGEIVKEAPAHWTKPSRSKS